MKRFPAKSRLWLSLVIMAAFFIPAYHNISGFNFIPMALAEPATHKDVSQTDVLMITIPLLLIPLSALLIFFRAFMRLPTRKTVVFLPFIFLCFFILLLPFSGNVSKNDLILPRILFSMQPGFYLVAVSALLLAFTKNYKKRRGRKRRTADPLAQEVAAA